MCSCGCNKCDTKPPKLNEGLLKEQILSEGLRYHISKQKPLTENVYRAGSGKYFGLWAEARVLYSRGVLEIDNTDDLEVLTETDLGYFDLYEGKKVPLDFPMLDEAKYQGKDVSLNKPKRGGSKAYYVYVKDPKTKKVKKVSFGSGGLKAKINNSKARQAFAKRHNCKDKKDKTKAGYWSCRLPRYAKLLGLKSNFSGFW